MLLVIRKGGINNLFPKFNYYNNYSIAMSHKCKVAVCQLTATNNKENNLKIVKALFANAIKGSAKMVFFPEASDYIALDTNEAKALSEPLDGPLIGEYRNLAKSHRVWVSIGFHEKYDETTMYNSHALIDDEGQIKSLYRKIHLYDISIPEKHVLLKESEVNIGGGQMIPPTKTPAGSLGLCICYDVRFPEQSILLTKLGAEILTFPSAFTSATGQAHWELLLRTRAVESQCFVIAAAQYGKHNSKRTSYGQAMIVDPWGRIIAECPRYPTRQEVNESVAFAEIDLNFLAKVRQEMPVFLHRRNDIYNLNLVKNEIIPIDDNESYSFANNIISGSQVFYKSKYCFAFTNIKCAVPGHVLVATLRVAPRLVDLSQEEIADLFQTAIKIQRVMEQEHTTDSSNVCVQDGRYAGQTVPHVHVHILPRRQGDFDRTDDVYLQLANHDLDKNTQLRSQKEMSAEAKLLRKYFK